MLKIIVLQKTDRFGAFACIIYEYRTDIFAF